ncbi:S8 family peptidase [Limnohabitans sp. DM1]|uniref:S8 family peptidase n=1 Tax=Limnohabitans sp. DM1 TaxID=1597955 RepID=UPI000AB59D08|nr:S8 family peptidase [Limnohabitans sp. DM1]
MNFAFKPTFQTLALGGLLVLGAGVTLAQTPAPKNTETPMHVFGASKPIQNRYIVVFTSDVADPAQEAQSMVRGGKGTLHHTFKNAIKGFAASIPAAALPGLLNNPRVDYIEQDQSVSLNQATSPQSSATWGLDRIDQASLPLNSQYKFNGTGAATTAFIIDSGLRADHVDFTGRVLPGYNVVADANGTNDCNGHGTHVAGTVGGSTWGVAKSVNLVPVRVLDCAGSGTLSGVVAGIDWVAGSTLRPAVANMSLGSAKSSTVNAAVAGAYNKGVTMVVAAGNNNADACSYSPSSEPMAITVGATTNTDARASYSNYGTCLDVFAPGTNITSAWHTGSTASNTISGTSMASPHVTGVAALALQANPLASPAQISSFITSYATLNKVSTAGTGSPNRLLYSLASIVPAPAQTIAIRGLTGKSSKSGTNWKAQVTATVRDVNSSVNVANATVTGNFAPGGTLSCVTASTGSCTLTSGSISKLSVSTTFTVSNVSGTNMVYDASQNTATQLTFSKP